jgi:hypothetical protein
MRYRLVLACLAATIICAPAAQAQCMKAMGEARAAGYLTVGRFSDAAGRAETAYILRLTRPVCLDGAEDREARKGTRRVHLFSPDARLGRNIQRLVGRNVIVSGTPFGQHTSHHHAPIVMTVTDIRTR